jgi:hypothetical protein
MKMQVYLVGNHVIKLCLKEDGTLAAINGLRSQVTFSLSVTFVNLAFCVLQLGTFFFTVPQNVNKIHIFCEERLLDFSQSLVFYLGVRCLKSNSGEHMF